MDQELAISVSRVFGLAFDVEKASNRLSGFESALVDLGSGKPMFGDLRLEGFASLLRIGFADHLTIIGGDEGRYRGEEPAINRAAAIRAMLMADCGIAPYLVTSIPSASNTGGNIAIIKEQIEACPPSLRVAVVTSHYHVPRAAMMMAAGGLSVPVYSAEAFLLLEGVLTKEELVKGFGGGLLAERMGEEIQGIADLIRGTYVPRTDTPASVA